MGVAKTKNQCIELICAVVAFFLDIHTILDVYYIIVLCLTESGPYHLLLRLKDLKVYAELKDSKWNTCSSSYGDVILFYFSVAIFAGVSLLIGYFALKKTFSSKLAKLRYLVNIDVITITLVWVTYASVVVCSSWDILLWSFR